MTADSKLEDRERRRSHRVTLQVPVRVDYFANLPGRLASETTTIKVNAHGALLVLPWGVPVGQEMLLRNLSSNETEIVTVVFINHQENGHYEVAVEFKQPNPKFWGVSFPPDDWTPAHRDAKPTSK